jgi:hypothetical protein
MFGTFNRILRAFNIRFRVKLWGGRFFGKPAAWIVNFNPLRLFK